MDSIGIPRGGADITADDCACGGMVDNGITGGPTARIGAPRPIFIAEPGSRSGDAPSGLSGLAARPGVSCRGTFEGKSIVVGAGAIGTRAGTIGVARMTDVKSPHGVQ